jgi:hypothetical protein
MTPSARIIERPFRLDALMALQVREYHEMALPEVLGDAALLNRLPPLNRLRGAVREYDYAFAPAETIAGAHSMFPLLELTEILGKRTIPYRRTANAARHLLARTPDIAMSPRLFRDLCVANYVAHESAHALVYEIVLGVEGRLTGDRYVETMLTSEAFAIAFEQFIALVATADGRRSTSLFLATNAYVTPADIVRNSHVDSDTIGYAAKASVAAPTAVLTMLSAVNLIALVRPTAGGGKPGLAERLGRLLKLEILDARVLNALVVIGLRVDFDFRSTMQRNFYEYLGLERHYAAFLALPIEEILPRAIAPFSYLADAIQRVAGEKAEDS